MIIPRSGPSLDDIAGHYDDLDHFYRRVWGDHVHHGLWNTGNETPEEAVEQLIEHVAEGLQLQAGDRVCDVGCGYGGTARWLAARHEVQVTGLTISRSQFDYACGHSVEGIEAPPTYLLRAWEENGFPPAAFDRVVSVECLEHIVDKQQFFDEIYRVLRPGGRSVVTAWLAGDAPTVRQHRHLLEPICREGRLPALGTQGEYTDCLQRAGLTLECFEDLSQRVARTWRVCLRRIGTRVMTRADSWAFLLRGKSAHTVFLLTMARIAWAYRQGVMRYGYFVATKDA